MCGCDSTRIFSRVQKILLVPFGAGKAAGTSLEKLEAQRVQAFANREHRSFLKFLALYDAAGTDLVARQFKLRLDENQKCGVWFCNAHRSRNNLQNRNKRYV